MLQLIEMLPLAVDMINVARRATDNRTVNSDSWQDLCSLEGMVNKNVNSESLQDICSLDSYV